MYLIHEPDNEKNNVVAALAKKNRHRMPYLSKKTNDNEIYKFWHYVMHKSYLPGTIKFNHAFLKFIELSHHVCGKNVIFKSFSSNYLATHANGPLQQKPLPFPARSKNSKRRIIKSVHAGLSLSYLTQHFYPKVVLVFRHPANIVTSYLQLQLPDADRKVFIQNKLQHDYLHPFMSKIENLHEPLSLMGLQIAIHYYVWEQQLMKYQNWITVSHEKLCRDPIGVFKDLFTKLGLEWNDVVRRYLKYSNTAGAGYEIKRIASSQIDKWKMELTPEQIKLIRKGYSILPLKHYNAFQK